MSLISKPICLLMSWYLKQKQKLSVTCWQIWSSVGWVEMKCCLLKRIYPFLALLRLLKCLDACFSGQFTWDGEGELCSLMNFTGTLGFISIRATAACVCEACNVMTTATSGGRATRLTREMNIRWWVASFLCVTTWRHSWVDAHGRQLVWRRQGQAAIISQWDVRWGGSLERVPKQEKLLNSKNFLK